jgi:hypothetical protein
MASAFQQDTSFLDIWRKIPPEEKLLLMAQSQARGISASSILLATIGSISLGLRVPWLFWSAFVTIPFVFQLASAKAWRDLKPRTMLEYLGARSAARRYAYSANAKDLTVSIMMKGVLSPEYSADDQEEAIEARIEQRDHVDVWVALFPDTIVMMSERAGGAKLEFAQSLLGDKFEVEAEGFDDRNEERRLVFTIGDKKTSERHRWFLTSPFPAALLVLERRMRAFLEEQRLAAEKERLAYTELFAQKVGELDDL